MKNVGIILAAGFGKRFNDEKAKQFFELDGKEVIQYVLDAFYQSKNTEKILVVLSKEEYEKELNNPSADTGYDVVLGGKTRPESQYNALQYLAEHYPDCEKIIFHDAARPLIDHEVFDKYFLLLDTYDYVCTCQKITDSLGCHGDSMPKREDFFLLQTPEGYRFKKLYNSVSRQTIELSNYYMSYSLPKECQGYFNYEIKYNHKLTYPEDICILEALLKFKHRLIIE